MQRKNEMSLLRKHVAQLMEHFDSVQIFVSRTDGENTVSASRGGGNRNTRTGQVRDWITYNDEIVKGSTRATYEE